MQEQLIVTERDFNRLNKMLQSRLCRVNNSKASISLELNLCKSKIVKSSRVPQTVVTMNTTVGIRDMDNDEREVYTLVYPQEANIDQNKLSVFSPLGALLLGSSVGDVVQIGIRLMKIENILYQPEAAGDWEM